MLLISFSKIDCNEFYVTLIQLNWSSVHTTAGITTLRYWFRDRLLQYFLDFDRLARSIDSYQLSYFSGVNKKLELIERTLFLGATEYSNRGTIEQALTRSVLESVSLCTCLTIFIRSGDQVLTIFLLLS